MGEVSKLPIIGWADITPEWMTDMLRGAGYDATVGEVTGKRVGTGQVGESVRFRLSYRGDAKGAPSTVVGKFPSPDPESRATGVNFGNYIREVNFYRYLADSAGLTTPVCHYTDVDPVTSDFVLIMEDLGPAVPGDQIRGTSIAEAALVLEEAAKFHASHWNDDAMDEIPWLFETAAAPKRTEADFIVTLWKGFRERYGSRIPADCMEIGEALMRNYGHFKAYDGPRCLTHNDFRPDNMMFGTAQGGYPVSVVDWQSIGYGCCMADVSYFLSGALKREERRAHEETLLTTYHRRLGELGVTGYSFEEMMKHYALYSFSLFNMAFTASMIVERTERGDNMFFQMLRGGADHVLDTGALSLLPD